MKTFPPTHFQRAALAHEAALDRAREQQEAEDARPCDDADCLDEPDGYPIGWQKGAGDE